MPLFTYAMLSDPDRVSSCKPLSNLYVGFHSSYGVALCFIGLTRLNSFSGGASPLTACVIPCVRLHHFVRTLVLLNNANTRYEWMANPYSTETLEFATLSPSLRKRHRASLGAQDATLGLYQLYVMDAFIKENNGVQRLVLRAGSNILFSCQI